MRTLAILITVILGMWASAQGIEQAMPGALGLDQRAMLWISIIMTGLGVAQGFLPAVLPGPGDHV